MELQYMEEKHTSFVVIGLPGCNVPDKKSRALECITPVKESQAAGASLLVVSFADTK
jgi:hypothetical protein